MHLEATARLGAVVVLLSACRATPDESQAPPRPAPLAPTPAAAKLPLELPPGRAGDWVEAKRYRLRVLDALPCDEPPAEGTTVPVDDTVEPDMRPPSATTPGKPGHFRLGVALEVEANDTVFTTPRAASLEKNGKVFPGIVDPRPSAACRALLAPRTLRSAERASGIVVFEAPNAEYLKGATLKFHPPRWGRESRVSVVLPSCFGKDCPPAGRTAEASL